MKRYNTIEEIKAEIARLLQERLALIDVGQDKFAIAGSEKAGKVSVTVTYDGIKIFTVRPFISNVIENGRIQVRGMFGIRAVFDDYWYDNDDLDVYIFVDEFLRCQFQNQSTTFDKLLDILLPLADESKVKRICEEFDKIGFKNVLVRYDTYSYKYLVEGDIRLFLYGDNAVETKDDRKKIRFFKYLSFNTYIEILKSKKIRLNSIMSMNDSSETFYLGDYLCKAYEDERRKVLYPQSQYFQDGGLRKKKVVEYKNNLIGCFSEKEDDALMWRLYGDGGKGVCMEFQIENETLKPVLYLDENNQKVKQLMDVARMLKHKGISLYYNDLSNYHFYTKSRYFRDEKEWRIIKEVNDNELEVANYGGLVSLYKDFPFDELGLKPTMVYLGANLAYKDVNVPLLVDLSKRELNVRNVMMSQVESLRV